MFDETAIDQFRRAGSLAIEHDGATEVTTIPLEQEGVVFQQVFEYAVADFEAEVGFFASIFGFPAIALTDDYALFTHPQHGYCFSVRKHEHLPLPESIGLKLLFMTSDLDAAESHLSGSGLIEDRETRLESPTQRVIYFTAPSGLAIEIWEDPSPTTTV